MGEAARRVLITGCSGFVGGYLARHIRSEGAQVWGGTGGPASGLDEALKEIVEPVTLDVGDRDQVMRAVTQVAPQEIYHLAAISRPAADDHDAFYRVNLGGTLNLLEAARSVRAAMLVVSSAYVYGDQPGVLSEAAELRPVNDYGVSKAAADLAGYSYALQDVRVVRVRPFNHVGPGQSPDFVLPTLIRQIARIEAGLEPPRVRVGNLGSVRDFTDVRDVVSAYPRLLREGEVGAVYNLASGVGTSIGDLLDMLRARAAVPFEVEVEPARVRKTDIASLVGDASRLQAAIGWHPSIPLDRTLDDMLEFERDRARQGA